MAARGSADIVDGRYRLDGLLGAGGSADVHRGFDLRLRRPVAVKVFRPDTGFDIEESWRSEAVILARLQHPGLVTVYDAGHHGGHVFLVMELIDGTTLKSRIAQGPLPFAEVAELGAGLAHALDHAHEARIVHRDVKPSNILLDASHRPYLTDFGISRLLDATTRTASGTLTGTAAYLSPEQVLGQPVGRPADVYALGLVLLESLTGTLEYAGGPLEAAIARLHRKPAIPSGIPEPLAAVLRDMTALDEAERPSAAACARALTQAAEQAGSDGSWTHAVPQAHAPGPTQTAHRTHRSTSPRSSPVAAGTAFGRQRVRIVGASAVIAALVAGAVVVSNAPGTPGNDQSGTRTSATPPGKGPSSVAQKKKSSPDASGQPSRPATSSGSLPGEAPDQSSHSLPGAAGQPSSAASPFPASGRVPAPDAPNRGGVKADSSHQPPGQIKKSAKSEKGATTHKTAK
ncbi:protein kinase [Streptomyces sp. NPDC005244]|uniref:serine/threonine-protein kinase n=1 Tax=Streptomyces sp. NPDC005244 TaxID=3364708 RepID=UPI00367ED606